MHSVHFLSLGEINGTLNINISHTLPLQRDSIPKTYFHTNYIKTQKHTHMKVNQHGHFHVCGNIGSYTRSIKYVFFFFFTL